jgi:hypothetical protein
VWQRGIIRFQAAACIFYPNGGRMSPLNTDTFQPDYMASHTRRLWSSLDCQISQDAGSLCTSSIMDGPSSQGVCHVRSCDVWCVVRKLKQCIISFVVNLDYPSFLQYECSMKFKCKQICFNQEDLWHWFVFSLCRLWEAGHHNKWPAKFCSSGM